ncbi:MopE-related protein, partial [Flavobacteriaceae bacterium]|nr:MopE-related protein [Flavobacteriaceae bacterium]
SYTDGAPIFENWWTDWGCGGGPGCALMASSAQARSGNLSGLIPGDGSTDAVLDLGNKILGQWGLEFWMYIPAGKTAYYNLQGTVPIGSGEWIVGNIFFNQDGANPGGGSIDDSALGVVEFTYPEGQWFPVVMNFDISQGIGLATWQFNINGNDVLPAGTPFTSADGTTATSVGGIDFFSIDTNIELYIDDLCYGEGFIGPNDPEPDVDNDGDGFTEEQGDCNDNDSTIYPGAEEICDDGIDQDCNGSDCTTPPPPPPGPCDFDNPNDGTFENGFACSSVSAFQTANDLDVAAGGDFTLNQITASIFANGGIASVDVIYYDNDGGLPGTEIGSELGLTPSSQAVIGNNFGIDVNEIVLDLTPVVFTEGKYWVELSVTDGGATGSVFWVITTSTSMGEPVANFNGGWGNPEAGQDGVVTFSGVCGPNDPEPDVDNDSDGYTADQGDCNDNDATIYPGAEEICDDGIDQDCNGSDLSCNDIDNDGDGFTEEQGDCNDNDATIYPGAEEICDDGIDQDCNGSDLLAPTIEPLESQEICEGTSVQLNATAANFDQIVWTTNGDGTFSNPTILTPIFTPGPTDIDNSSLILTLLVFNQCGSVTSGLTLSITQLPTVDAGPSIDVCEGPFQITGASASNFEQLQWTTDGDGTFSDANTLTPTYTPGSSDISNGVTFLTLTAENDCGIMSDTLICNTVLSSSLTLQGNDAQILCNGDQLETITYFPSNGGDVSPETLVTGLPSGIEFINNGGGGIDIFGTPTVDINVTTTYTYTISNYTWEGECPGDDVTGTITIQPCDDIDNDGDGFTENQGDCNDNDATIYPGAEEICDDGIDQDCDGSDCESEPCEISNPSNNFETGIQTSFGFMGANDFIISNNFTLMQINLNLFHDTAATISTVTITYYEDAGGLPGALIGTETLLPASQIVIGSNFGYNVSEVILDISPVNFTEGTYWIGATAVSSNGQLTAWETTSASSIGADSAISGDGGNSWGSGRDDGVFTLMGTCND